MLSEGKNTAALEASANNTVKERILDLYIV